MSKIIIKRVVGAASAVLMLCSAGLIVAAAKMNQGGTTEWPTEPPYNAAIQAFDAALTKAVREPAFRARLTQSTDSAKQAVAEAGHINIPANRVIMFYEAQATPGASPSPGAAMAKGIAMNWDSRSNENIHVFVLPPKESDVSKTYLYEDYFMCCYQGWRRANPPGGR
jgi:hypothetical protein